MEQIQSLCRKVFRIFIYERLESSCLSVIISILLSAVLGSSMFQVKEKNKEGFCGDIFRNIWIGIFNSIQTICRREIIKKRNTGQGSIILLCGGTLIYQAAICGVRALTMVIIYGIFTPLRNMGWCFKDFIMICFLRFSGFICGRCPGLSVSSIVKTTTAAADQYAFVLTCS